MVHVTIDTSLPENVNPKPEPEDGEYIEVFHVPVLSLWEECKRLEEEGFAIDGRIGMLAEGVKIAKDLLIPCGSIANCEDFSQSCMGISSQGRDNLELRT